MTGDEYALDVLGALSAGAPLNADGFQVRADARGNVARLITAVLRARLPNSVPKTVKSLKWRSGEVAFKNFTPTIRFWTKVTQPDLNNPDDLRAWICSSIDHKSATLHVWVIPFSMIRRCFAEFPKDAKHRADLQIVRQREGGWTFIVDTRRDNPPELGEFHREFSLQGLKAFQEARAADVAQGSAAAAIAETPEADGVSPNQTAEPPPDLEIPGENRIYFGPPGTGKSHRVRNDLEVAQDAGRARTVTFHPEYSYADFVGTYRPTMVYGGEEQYRDMTGKPVQFTGRPAVVYEFVPGPLVQMICNAMLRPGDHFYLIIEEINRGNCAAIFGDLFQLLDRHEDGESEYAVWVEADLMEHVRRQLGGQIDDETRSRFDREGLFLPSNLSIRATMNTSDQSLYPMDAAMKRRWQMEYVPIDYDAAKGRIVELPGYGKQDWGDVLRQLNRRIVEKTQTDDKQIGQWFVLGDTISPDTFRDKVLSYLWFDVFRHSPRDIFNLEDAASYEALVKQYNDNRPVFDKALIVFAQERADGVGDGG